MHSFDKVPNWAFDEVSFTLVIGEGTSISKLYMETSVVRIGFLSVYNGLNQIYFISFIIESRKWKLLNNIYFCVNLCLFKKQFLLNAFIDPSSILPIKIKRYVKLVFEANGLLFKKVFS